MRPVAYFSTNLALGAASLHVYVQWLQRKGHSLCQGTMLAVPLCTLLVPHSVTVILQTADLSGPRLFRHHTWLLDMPNVTVKCCNILNPASLLPLPDETTETRPQRYTF